MKELEGLRVALVLNDSRMGGAERQALLLAGELAGAGMIPIVVGTATDGFVYDEARRMGFEAATHLLRYPLSATYFPRNLFRAWRLFRKIRADVIIGYTSVPNLYIGWLGRLTGARAFIWSSRNAGLDRPRSWMERVAFRRATAFIANSPSSRDFLLEAFPVSREMTTVIPNGVGIPTLASDTSGLQVICVANARPVKDHVTLLQAWQIVRRDCPAATLHLVGQFREGASYTRRIQAIASAPELAGSVHFAGIAENITPLLIRSSVGVLSSKSEGMPNVVLEYMAAGLPVVATDLPGTRMALGDDASHWMFSPGDAPTLADRLLELLGSKELRAEWGARNRARAANEFSISKMGERTISVIRESLK